ncbi:RsmB/NOP family class I SAM-dependent RNA methyltransferase [Loktanella sp. DJP18]|uniref:RsmB/NOP family class I SAM-dependent RNA methyltransferase n=1 Tax=Loktanella sp. DJP18 TaxID=3409788 RepID=UPI003BB6E47C
MTPAARYAAAIVVLDQIVAGAPAERALTTWARTNLFAGSGDRAAIRDHVYDVLRARRSLAIAGGGDGGRALVLGLLRRDGIAPDTVFGAGGHAPPAMTEAERRVEGHAATDAETADLPDWLWPIWQDSLGDGAMPVALVQQRRAGLHLRVNLSRISRDAAQAKLLKDGIATVPHPEVVTGLTVLDQPRKVAGSATLAAGWVEVQDAASQIALAQLPLTPGMRVLDYCAGGGGKALGMADRLASRVWAHDVDPRRMIDIPGRAKRAGVEIDAIATAEVGAVPPFDLVLCDAPCSGSGTWRRTPDAKWQLTADRLRDLNETQASVLARGASLCAKGGAVAYATCSVLASENDGIVGAFLSAHPDWTRQQELRLWPTALHDGFYMAVLRRT